MGVLVVVVAVKPLLEAGGQGFLAKWTGFSCKVDGVFLQSGRGFLARHVKVKSTPSLDLDLGV